MALNSVCAKILETDFHSLYSSMNLEQFRAYYLKSWNDSKGDVIEVGSVLNRIVKTSIRDTPIRIYSPETTGNRPAFIWVHGGRFGGRMLSGY